MLGRISELREKHIVGHAGAHLDAGEEVVRWARAREHEGRKDGFVYLTKRRLVVHWLGRDDGHCAMAWSDVRAWGVNGEHPGGPLLALESDSDTIVVRLPVATGGTARRVSDLVAQLTVLAPKPSRALSVPDEPGSFRSNPAVPIDPGRRSVAAHTRRIAVTTLGVALLTAGVVMLVIPGPGIVTVLFGLAVLGNEYDWAKDLLAWAKGRYKDAAHKLRRPGS